MLIYMFSALNESWGENVWQRFVTGVFQKEPHQYVHPAGEPEASISCVIRSLR
jgi:hypothetical protein